MKKFLILPAVALIVSCGGNDEVASGTFDDGEGNEGSYSVRGDEDDSETVIKTDKGEVRLATGAKAAEDLPLGLELYPGAKIKSSMSGSGEGKSGAMIVFESGDDQDDVVNFYKKQLTSKGIKVEAEVRAGDMQMIGGEGVNMTVTKNDKGGVTGTLIAGEGN